MAGYLIEVNCTSNGVALQARLGASDTDADGAHITADQALASTQSVMVKMWTAKGKAPQDVTASVLEIR